ncbi:MAG TPA: acyl-CoA dehydrogenase family protein [Acidobacteriota bacterium]|mgnify:FL=1|nr:acyl-CoA dehydrogenase family protein [Acidobacteriota bacterium]HQF85916.1 acyl-CoA dehydrogenase family protein [Acidobacteriota bacterium]HQG90840.1 acyl-CoA dehydrogenase family protein [Acidobacteriota bacterium]HQK86616.1 acyl-CoA dehydrogenase family protein [Acidobacteriota bacterium]
MKPFHGVDYFGFDALLSDEERMVRDTVRRFIDEQVKPVIETHHREGHFPVALIRPMAELGLLGANLTGYGLPGLGHAAYGLIMQELERGDSGIRSFASVQGALVMYPIHAFGSEEQRAHWLPRLGAGEAVGCFGLTEPDFGSNPGGMTTRAEATADGFVLNGSKMWITNGDLADVAVVFAKLGGEVNGFLVERGTPGFTTQEIKGKFSLRASDTATLFLEDCRIPAANRLPGARGLKTALMCLTQARYGIAWGVIGAAMECYHTALQYAKERVQFGGRPIAAHQLVQEKLVWMITEITKAQFLTLHAARLKDAGELQFHHVSMIKRNNVDMALQCARLARDILGAAGIVDDHPVIRHLLNLESVRTYEGTHDIHTLIIGQQVTGEPAYGE